MMDNNWGDHNGFSKVLLGWVEPAVVNEGSRRLALRPSSSSGDALILMHGDPVADPFHEYFIAEYRCRSGNDIDYPTDGVLVWHIDARVDPDGRFLFDNSYTEHKLIRLMEADGLEEIEQNFGADAGDFYGPGDVFSSATTPSSHRYDGSPTNLLIDDLESTASTMDLHVDLGSGCGIFADVVDPVTGWPGVATSFRANADFANCDGVADPEWSFGDGGTATGDATNHLFSGEGSYSWELSAELGDASLQQSGEVLICDDPRCFQWRPVPEMRGRRLQHSAVVLDDGRVLVVGGGPPPQIYEPGSGRWFEAAPSSGLFLYASARLLEDGRVFVTGSTAGDPVNAEIYDPTTNRWEVTDRMGSDRVMHSSLVLADGRVLVAGGYFGGTHAILAEIWDPDTGSWTVSGSTGIEEVPGLALLNDGDVLCVGSKVTRLFNPVTGQWRRISDLVYEHRFGATVTLPDGRVMVIGGEGTGTTEIFDPTLNLWRPNSPLNGIRAAPTARALPSGHVVVTGGADRFWRVGSCVEIFDPVTGVWTEVQPMRGRRLAHAMSVLQDGSVLVTGGTTNVLSEPLIGLTTAERFRTPAQVVPPRNSAGRRLP
jgi:hypothetical protein